MIKLNANQQMFIESIREKFNENSIKESLSLWLEVTSSSMHITDGSTYHEYNLERMFPGCKRKDVYEAIVNYSIKRTKVTVAIPVGDGFYLTVFRSCSGSLVISDKSYKNINTIRRHNENVPGKLTIEELMESPIRWVLQFAEVVND